MKYVSDSTILMKQVSVRATLMKQNGYTLIEILVVITIMTTLFSFGYANFRDFSRRQTLQGAVKQVQGSLRKAQQSALSGVKPDDPKCNNPQTLNGYGFKIESSLSQYSVFADCSGGNAQIGSLVDLPSGITASTPLNPIIFKVLGSGTNIVGGDNVITFTQTVGGKTSTISVGPGGDIK